jgi:hypothetical protein
MPWRRRQSAAGKGNKGTLAGAAVAAPPKAHAETFTPILRVFKEEAELEVWKQDTTGHFQLLKTYPICRWSGDLGPKMYEGDRQTPEGFYTITPKLMNPNSNFRRGTCHLPLSATNIFPPLREIRPCSGGWD